MTYPVRPVTATVRIPRPADTVFDFVADTRNDPLWCPNVTSVRQVGGDGVEVGARYEFHQTLRARGRELESEVSVEIQAIDGRSITTHVEDRFQTRRIVLSVTPDGDGSKVTQRTEASFKHDPGLAKWVYPILARRTLNEQLQRLSEHLVG